MHLLHYCLDDYGKYLKTEPWY